MNGERIWGDLLPFVLSRNIISTTLKLIKKSLKIIFYPSC